MRPPDYLIKKGVTALACVGDGRQSGTSGSPSILNASPEAATGGGLALLKTGDKVRIDLKKRTANMLISDEELEKRRAELKAAGAAGEDNPVVEMPIPGLVRTRWEIGGAVRSDSRDLAYAVGDALSALAQEGRLKAICAAYGVTYTPPQGY